MTDPPVAVAVVSWNTRELLGRCLDSLADAAAAGRAGVWVVDNGSTDGSRELVTERYPWATLMTPAENLGLRAGGQPRRGADRGALACGRERGCVARAGCTRAPARMRCVR
jgi:GT2 family glycosyltransferase